MADIYFLTPGLTPQDYTDTASAKYQDAEESFQRCDTDGFLSQRVSDQSAKIYQALASLAENGGKADVLVLCDLDGNEVNAKVVNGRFGPVWCVVTGQDEYNNDIVEWVNYRPARETTIAKKGYQEVWVEKDCAVLAQWDNNWTLHTRYVPDTRKNKNPYWCCNAKFGEHEETCDSYKA